MMKLNFHSLLTISLSVLLLTACFSPQIQPVHTQTPTSIQNIHTRLTITLADNGKTIGMQVGESVLLNLGNEFDWSVSIADESILSLEKDIVDSDDTQGVYQAHKAGTTVMSISGDPACRASNPPCMMPSMLFQVTIVVK